MPSTSHAKRNEYREIFDQAYLATWDSCRFVLDRCCRRIDQAYQAGNLTLNEAEVLTRWVVARSREIMRNGKDRRRIAKRAESVPGRARGENAN